MRACMRAYVLYESIFVHTLSSWFSLSFGNVSSRVTYFQCQKGKYVYNYRQDYILLVQNLKYTKLQIDATFLDFETKWNNPIILNLGRQWPKRAHKLKHDALWQSLTLCTVIYALFLTRSPPPPVSPSHSTPDSGSSSGFSDLLPVVVPLSVLTPLAIIMVAVLVVFATRRARRKKEEEKSQIVADTMSR